MMKIPIAQDSPANHAALSRATEEMGYDLISAGDSRGSPVWPEGLALESAIINLAHSLKLKLLAEGVEAGEPSRLLLNCDEMQGFYSAKRCRMRFSKQDSWPRLAQGDEQ